MSTAPQVFIDDYSTASIVVRADPPEFFRDYSSYLTNLGGKFNRNLRARSGTGKEPGWIFSKRRETEVRNTINQIISGQLLPSSRSVGTSSGVTGTVGSVGTVGGPLGAMLTGRSSLQPTSYGLPAIIPAGQSQPVLPSAPLSPLSPQVSQPVMTLPGGAPLGYQQVMMTVIQPTVGQNLILEIEGQRIPVSVLSKTNDQEYTIRLPDGQETRITLEAKWTIPGFNQAHQISRD